MQISPQINPGVYEYDAKRRKQVQRFKKAVDRAQFLDEIQKKRWKAMAYVLDSDQLEDAEQLIILEDLHRLHVSHKLEKLNANRDDNAPA